jgi:hypothetical protein
MSPNHILIRLMCVTRRCALIKSALQQACAGNIGALVADADVHHLIVKLPKA